MILVRMSSGFCALSFAPIANAHPYSARKFTCDVMHRARALSTKMNNDRADGHRYSFAWIKDLGCSVTPTFLSETDFIYNYLHIVQK